MNDFTCSFLYNIRQRPELYSYSYVDFNIPYFSTFRK